MNSRYLIIGTVDKPCQERRYIHKDCFYFGGRRDLDFEDRMDKRRLYRWNFFSILPFLRNIVLLVSFSN